MGKAAKKFADDLAAISKPLEPAEKLAYDRQLMSLQAKNSELAAKYKAAMNSVASLEEELEAFTKLGQTTKCKPWKPGPRAKHGQATAMLLLSDLHVEETVLSENINGLNEYNLDIADLSLRTTFEKFLLLLDDARHLANIRKAVIWLGGDIINGYIHEEAKETNGLAPIPATFWAAERIEKGLRMIAEQGEFDQITVLTSVGNHGRTTVKPRNATSTKNSFEQAMYVSLCGRTRDIKQLRWQIGEAYHNYLDVEGFLCRFHHGDKIKYRGGVGGLTIPANKSIDKWNKSFRAAYDFFGHLHTYLVHHHIFSNGSMVGYNAYACEELKAEFQPPMQGFSVIDTDNGMTRAQQIFCRKVKRYDLLTNVA